MIAGTKYSLTDDGTKLGTQIKATFCAQRK